MTSSAEAASRSQVIDLDALRDRLPELAATYGACVRPGTEPQSWQQQEHEPGKQRQCQNQK